MRFNTPLRYPGGKGKLSNFMLRIIEDNKLSPIHYAEPYAGGAGLALKLLHLNVAEKIILNDINISVYAFWHSVLNNADHLCALIEETEVTMDEWFKQKEIINNPKDHDMLTIGFSTFFLNRTNRSGILKGGVIGGKHQEGQWKLDARYNKSDLISRIQKISKNREKIDLYNMDAIDFIKKIVVQLPKKSLTYLDPPYYIKGKGLYINHYEHSDHVNVAKVVQNDIKTPWIVSYDNTPEIQSMYKASSLVYGINYSAQDRYKGSEVMFFSKRLKVFKTDDPTKVKAPTIKNAMS
ncbi:TPA: DNA adenine methylase [Klebsiella oxytoca]|uniref:DNA adenine methylase n=1 Tax=Klebsiella sp. RHBSTW-00215 TaxID=2742640 RepID=UPI0015F497DE|nr:DNA adenine methylase [Klebsiella sp. RHBSTW-00215]MBA7935679.1 DNA adenine methylase [Klebsiella sp. RHBSTW-00215]HBM3043765.1 DNA adenine methylase [Klebsiella oxytoca]